MAEQTGRDAAIRLIAENQLRRYDNEFDASHLHWRDFEGSAAADVDALAAAGLLRTASEPSGDVVETVAKAMWSGPPEWDSAVVEALGHADQYRAMARAAIAAIGGGQ